MGWEDYEHHRRRRDRGVWLRVTVWLAVLAACAAFWTAIIYLVVR